MKKIDSSFPILYSKMESSTLTQEKSNTKEMQSPKKFWDTVRVVYFMLRKGFSKNKLMIHLKYIMMKRTKLAGKAIHNLLHHHHSSATPNHHFPDPLNEYEFSCSNSPSPNNFFPFHKKKTSRTSLAVDEDDLAVHAVMKALETLNSEGVAASPALPGFGRSQAAVRQLRITDSPFPLSDVDEDSHVLDEAAEEFIQKFYNNLRRQNALEAN